MFELISHPATPPLNVSQVTAQVSTSGANAIFIEYMVRPTAGVVFPVTRPAIRADELWKTTCFELFLMAGSGPRYFEFNLSPSSEWAAYAFDSYRAERQDQPLPFDPGIEPTETYSGDVYWLAVELPLPNPLATGIRLGFSAVIEEEGGHKSYWALAHPDGPPDFHDPTCFIARLPE